MEDGDKFWKLILLVSTALWLQLLALLLQGGGDSSVSTTPFHKQGLPLFCLFMAALGVAFYCSVASVFLPHHLPAAISSALLWASVVTITSTFCFLFAL